MQIKIKKFHKDAVVPKYAKPGDAGMDLTAVDMEYDQDRGVFIYSTGLGFQIPEGHVGLIFPRSSVCKTSMRLTNCVGVIDSGYRGEVKFVFDEVNDEDTYDVGDRIGQIIIMPFPQVEFLEVDDLEESERGTGGFGSSGK